MPLYLKHTGVNQIELQEGPILVPAPGQLLVKVHAVGGNPVDAELNGSIPNVGTTVGYDFAGTIDAASPAHNSFPPGTRVAGYTFGSCNTQPTWGAFGDYCIGFPSKTFVIPEGMSYEEAVTLPVGIVVAGLSIAMTLKVGRGEPLFVVGGSTNMGAVAIQYAKAAGASPIITVAGAKNHDYVKSLGADHVIDYHDPEHPAKIKSLCGDNLLKIFDARSNDSTYALCASVISPGGQIATLNPPPPPPTDGSPSPTYTMVNSFTSFGVPFNIFGMDVPAIPDVTASIDAWWEATGSPLVREGRIKPHGVRVIPGGLRDVKQGWELYAKGEVSGEKLVYRVRDGESSSRKWWGVCCGRGVCVVC